MRGGRTRSPMRLTGAVSSGLGRAQVFMAQDHYQTQFKAILENEAWPGTLNVKVDGKDLSKYVALRSLSGVDTLDLADDMKSKDYEEGVSCSYCINKTTAEQRAAFNERQRQVRLAKQRNQKHLGVKM